MASVLFEVAPAGSGHVEHGLQRLQLALLVHLRHHHAWPTVPTTSGPRPRTTTATPPRRRPRPGRVDNPIRGIDVQANNGNNQPGTGDTLTLSFNQPPSSTSILAAWNGTSKVVSIRFNEGSGGSSPDTITVLDGATTVGLGTIALNADFIDGGNGDTFTFPGTMVLSGNALTLAITGSGSGSWRVGERRGHRRRPQHRLDARLHDQGHVQQLDQHRPR